ncbi:MAG TPA: hypothetical protein VIK89_02620 [Cytophagaceae bacterium]
MSRVQTIRFKTDIDCIDCVNTVRNILDNMNNIDYWYLDMIGKDHELIIMGKDIPVDILIDKVNSKGFHLEKIR